jgi:hypothetical protein
MARILLAAVVIGMVCFSMSHPISPHERALDMDLEENLGDKFGMPDFAGWWNKAWVPAPPPATSDTCLDFAAHPRAVVVKAAKLADAVYLENTFDAMAAKTGLKVMFYLADGPDDLDYGIADPLPSGEPIPWVVFAGSESQDDWRINFDMWKVPAAAGMPGYVHSGFSVQWGHARDKVNEKMANLKNAGYRRVVFTGHSLGGAVATLAAAEMKHRHPELEVELINFGAPKPADEEWMANTNRLLAGHVSRVINSNDPVPCIPPLFSDGLTGATIWNMDTSNWSGARAHSCLYTASRADQALTMHGMAGYIQKVSDHCDTPV